MMKALIIKYLFKSVAAKAAITFVMPDGTQIGAADAVVRFQSWGDIFRIAFNPSIGFAEAWGHERVQIENIELVDFMQKMTTRRIHAALPLATRLMIRTRQGFAWLTQGWTARQSHRNVHHHYDLGNNLYALFLDEDWQYSCAYFDDPAISLDEAQHRKKEHIARKLQLDGSQHILDIGCGWSGLALHLAQYAQSVAGITLSEEQLKLARQRVADADAPFDLCLRDYRNEDRRFDRIVSVGMLEHVGKNNLGAFFRHVSRCLNDEGVALIHTIGRIGAPAPTDSFISKYIFPGGYLPSLSQLTRAIEETDLAVADTETLFLHYAETLKHWRQQFLGNRHKAVAMYDEFFVRIWEFYLAGCEASFRQGNIAVYQFQVLKPAAKRPAHRGYLYPEATASEPFAFREPEYNNLRKG